MQRRDSGAFDWLLAGLRRLTGLEWLAVAAATPLLLFPTAYPPATTTALVVLAMLWLLRWVVRREPWPLTPFNGALLVFALMIPVGVWASAFPDLTLPKVAGLVLGMAAFRAVVLAVRSRQTFILALVVFCLLSLVIAGVGVVAARWLDKIPLLTALTAYIPRLISSLPDMPGEGVHPNQIAGALTLYLPLAAALLAGSTRRLKTPTMRLLVLLGGGVFLLLVIGVLLLTQSRTGWIGGAIGLVSLVVLGGMSGQRRWMRLLGTALLLLTLVALAAALLAAGPQRVGEVLYAADTASEVEGVVGEMTLVGRLELWNRALYAIQDCPFTGCGLGTFRRVVRVSYTLFTIDLDRDVAHAHNIFLQTALDLGLPGLVAYLALLAIAGVVCWQAARSAQGGALARVAALGLLAGLVGLHVYGLADALALGAKPGVAFWFSLGLIAALPRVAQPEAREPRAIHVSRIVDHIRAHPWLAALAVLLVLALLTAGAYGGWRALQGGEEPLAQPAFRVPLYAGARDIEVRSVDPPKGAGWVGELEVATFTTVDSLASVADFYTGALAAGGWEMAAEVSDGVNWDGAYTQNEGRTVCLLKAFESEGQVWVSIVCGDNVDPVDLSPGR